MTISKKLFCTLFFLPQLGFSASLAPQLMSTEPAKRESALEQTKEMAPSELQSTLDELTGYLKKDDIDNREHAAQALGLLGPRAAKAVDPLRKCLNDELPYVRILSAEALSKIGIPAIPAFIEALNNANSEVRAIAASALGTYGQKAEEAIPSLVKTLSDVDSSVRQKAAHSLEQFGPRVESAVIDHLEKSHSPSRVTDIQILGNIKGEDGNVVTRLIAFLDDSDAQVRLASSKALLRRGRDHIAELSQGLKSESASVRAQVADVFADIGRTGSSAVPALQQMLRDSSPEVRGAAAHALGKMGSSAIVAVPALMEVAKDSNALVALKAREALTAIAAVSGEKKAPSEKPMLEQKITVPPPVVLPPEESTPAPDPVPVSPAPTKKKTVVTHAVATKKTKVKPPSKAKRLSPEELILQLRNSDQTVREGAEQMIIERSSETVPAVIDALHGPDSTLAMICAALLEKIGTPEARRAVNEYRQRELDKQLAVLLADLSGNEQAAKSAKSALVTIGASAVQPVSQLLVDPQLNRRRAAASILNQLGSLARPALGKLSDALEDGDEQVRMESAHALEKIGTPDAQKALRFFGIKNFILKLLGDHIH